MTYSDEQIEQLRKLIAMMRESGVTNFAAGDVKVSFDQIPKVSPELTTEDKLSMLKEELKRASDDSDADLMWSV